jgi:uncharacterized protein (DUF1499 family)
MNTKSDWTFAGDDTPLKGVWLGRISGILMILLCIDWLVIICAPLARIYLDIEPMLAFSLFAPGLMAGILLAILALVVTIVAVMKNDSTVKKRGVFIIMLGIIPVISIILFLGLDKIVKPAIHDISTDTQDPPEFTTARTLRSDNQNTLDYGGEEVANAQLAAYPEIQPITSDLSREQALIKASDVVFQLNWTLSSLDNDAGVLEAYDTTRIFGFVDDIVIRVRAEGTGSRIDIRSVSRVGMGDLGKNAERIERFIRLFSI